MSSTACPPGGDRPSGGARGPARLARHTDTAGKGGAPPPDHIPFARSPPWRPAQSCGGSRCTPLSLSCPTSPPQVSRWRRTASARSSPTSPTGSWASSRSSRRCSWSSVACGTWRPGVTRPRSSRPRANSSRPCRGGARLPSQRPQDGLLGNPAAAGRDSHPQQKLSGIDDRRKLNPGGYLHWKNGRQGSRNKLLTARDRRSCHGGGRRKTMSCVSSHDPPAPQATSRSYVPRPTAALPRTARRSGVARPARTGPRHAPPPRPG